jgi:hypothetical protein
MTFSGHGIRGPGVDLLHLDDSDRETFIAMEFHEDFAQHSSLTKGLGATLDTLKSIDAARIAPLHEWHRDEGALIYPTQGAISVREMTRAFRKLDEPIGEKAGLELLIGVARALIDFSEAAEAADLYCHGCICPWTLFVNESGEPLIVGFGIPPAPLFAFMDQQVDTLSANAFKYCPPERLDNGDEDIRSDFQSLALVITEVITGEGVYDGKADEVLEQIIGGKGPDALEEVAQDLPDATFELLCKALEPKLADRFSKPEELLAEAEEALKSATGITLAEAFKKAREVGISDDLGFDTEPEAPAEAAAAPAKPAATPAITTEAAPAVSAPTPVPAEPDPSPPAASQPAPAPAAPKTASAGGLPSLPSSATIDEVHQRAKDLADRADELVASIGEIIEKCRPSVAENAAVLGPILEEMEGSNRRAAKAAKATRSSVSLVELDESPDDALMSLDLLINSVQQVQSALQEVTVSEKTIEDILRAQRAEAQAIAVAHEQADECTAQAHQAWSEAQEALASFTDEVNSGKLAAPGIDAVLTEAQGATERARIATADSAEAANNAGKASTALEGKDAAAIARSAAESAKAAAEAVQELHEKAGKLADKATKAALDKIRSHATTTGESLSRADQAVQRADQALQVGPSAQASRLRDAAAEHLKAVQDCVDLQQQIMGRAQELVDWSALLDAIKSSNEQNTRAKEGADQAASCSDQIVALAGEAAAAAAELSKAIDEAKRIQERVESLTEQGRAEIDDLVAETEGITSSTAIQARSSALEGVSAAEKILSTLNNQLAQTEGQKDAASAKLFVDEMKESAAKAEAALKSARQSTRESKDSAEQEIEALKKERAHTQALDDAIDRAKQFTRQCDDLVSKAWDAYNRASEELKTTAIARAIELRTSAHEIIDIADYQAKEAAVASRQASEQTVPAEAESYADTARSFAERIAADLPEAHAAIEEAEELATREVRQLREARKQTESSLETATEIRSTIAATIQEGTSAAATWLQVASVSSALTKLTGSGEGLDVDIEELTYARDRAQQVDSARDAQDVLPGAKTALQRAQARKTAADSALHALKQAVAAAEQEQAAKAEAITEAQRLDVAAQEIIEVIEQAAKDLAQAVAEHSASGESVQASTMKMQDCQQQSSTANQDISGSVKAIQAVDSAAKANQLLAKIRECLKVIEGCRDRAAEAGTSGAAQSEREANTRADAAARRLANAHESARSSSEQAQRTVNSLIEKLASTEAEIANSSSGEAGSLRAKAEKSAAVIREQLANLIDDAAEVTQDLSAESAEREAAAIAQRAGTMGGIVAKALGFLDEAVDEARAAAAEEEALGKIHADAMALAEHVQQEVERSKAEAAEVVAVVAEATSDATKKVAENTVANVEAAEKAAVKLNAALPMLENADSLPVAQGILKTCRKALERARECADANAALVQEARHRLQEERELAAKELAEARRKAQAPAEQAAAAALKATGWLETGEREAATFEGEAIKEALSTLRSSVNSVKELSAKVAEIAIDASLAATVEEAGAVELKVTEAATTAMEAAKATREALDVLRGAVETAKADQAQVEVLQLEAAEHTTEAEKVKDAIHSTLTQLHEALDANEHAGEKLTSLTKQADTVGERIDEVLAEALAFTTAAVEASALAVVSEKSGQTKACFEQAVALLEELLGLDGQCREEMTRLAAEAEEEAKRVREEARKEREEARLAKEREREAVRAAGTQAFPINRKSGGEDRRARFERAKAERQSQRGDGDDLRARLRSSRGRSRGATGARPTRPTGSPRPGSGDRIRRSQRPGSDGAADRRLSRSPRRSRPDSDSDAEAGELRLPPSGGEDDTKTEAAPRRSVRRRTEDTETRERPSRRLERTPRGARTTRRDDDTANPEAGPVPTAPAPNEPKPPLGSKGADDLLARMRRSREKK